MSSITAPAGTRAIQLQIEWLTLGVAVSIYSGFAALTWFYHALPLWFVIPAGAYLIAWHGSLQHEAIHRHPTRLRWLNELLVFPNLWLWMPFRVYRDTHLAHHRDERLTDPLDDPESYYMTREQWQRCSRWTRGLLLVRNTVVGRILLGPFLAVGRLWWQESKRIVRGERRALQAWGLNGVSCALVLAWATGVCGIPVAEYVLFFAYPAIGLTLLRSFAEHRAAAVPEHRSVIVDAAWPLALVFLNNNLHALHHREPGVPWYRLPARYRAEREAITASNGGYRFRGYAEIIARYLLWPKEAVVHPGYLDGGRREPHRPD